jgi:flagellar protein FlaJ
MVDFRNLSAKIFGGLADKYTPSFLFVKPYLLQADMKIPLKTYLSLVFFTTFIAFLLSVAAVIVFTAFFKVGSLFLRIVYTIFLPFLVSILTFAGGLLYPIQKANQRRKSIETNLPFVLTHMGAIAESGVPPTIVFKLIAEFEEYGEISKEMKKITNSIENFGIDPLTAVKEVAERTPSEDFKQILLGFITTTETGGNIKFYLKQAGEQALMDWRIRRERFLQQLSAYAEFYTGILIAAPLFIIALFAVMNMIQPTIAGYDILFLTKASIYGIIPIVNGVFLLFLRSVEVEI